MDKRRSPRFTVVDLELYDHETHNKVGQVVNISRGGLLVNASQELITEDTYQFYIPFHQTDDQEVKFPFEGRVVWCQPNLIHNSKYSIGLEFADLPEIQTYFIQQLIKFYGQD